MASSQSLRSCTQSSKAIKSRRSWTPREEHMLLQGFKDIIAEGWKAPNGFKNGFITQLEVKLKESLPNTTLRGEPHISSKYGAWKKTFYTVSQALSQSGFSWNASGATVEAEPEEWETLIKAYPKCSQVRGKSFPYYDTWVEIYGKDRATGQHAMDWESATEGEHIDLTEDVDESGDSSFRQSNPPIDETRLPSAPAIKETGAESSKRHKRKKIDQTDEVLVQAFTDFCSEASKSIREVANRVGWEIDATRRRQELYEAIGKLPMQLSIRDHMKVCYVIGLNPKALDIFFGFPEAAKVEAVQMALEGQVNWV